MAHWLHGESADVATPPFHVHLGVEDERYQDGDGEGPTSAEALAAFARAAKIAPEEPDYHYMLGQALWRAGRAGEAASSLREAVALHPHEASYYLALGEVLTWSRHYDAAIDALRDAARLSATDAEAWSALGAALVAAGQPHAAVHALDTACDLAPRRADAHGNRGVALWAIGDRDSALAAFGTARRIAPDDVAVIRNHAMALLARGRAAEALEVLEAGRNLYPKDSALLIDTGDALFRLRRPAEAEAAYRAALEISPTSLDERDESRERFRALSAATMKRELGVSRPVLVSAAISAMDLVEGAAQGTRSTVSLVVRAVSATVVAVVLLGLASAAPAYVRHYLFRDDVATVAMTPLDDDLVVEERLMHAVAERHLSRYIARSNCAIATRPGWRVIECHYSAPVGILPGWARPVGFAIRVEKPYIDVARYDVPTGVR